MSVKINVNMTQEYMFDFMLYHNYTHASGLISALVGILALGSSIQYLLAGNIQYFCIWLLCAFVLLFINPSTMKSRAKAQVENSEGFKKPLEYELVQEGIIVRQEEQEVKIAWEEITKVVSTGKSILLYMGRVRALIFPKKCMGEQYEAVLKMIYTYVSPKNVKIRRIH